MSHQLFRLNGGPLDGQLVALPEGSTQLKVVVQDEPFSRLWGAVDSELQDAEVKTHAEFYVSTGFAGRLDYQPNPFHKSPWAGQGDNEEKQ